MVFNGALCRIIRGQFADNYMFISILVDFYGTSTRLCKIFK